MNKILTSLTLAATLTIAACSTNTQNENTALGAVTGAAVGGVGIGLAGGNAVAIGAGIVGGALIGGLIGHNMESSDNATGSAAMQSNATNETRTWTNRHTGTTYTMTPTSDRFTVNGNPDCRRFHFTATYQNGKTRTSNGTACLMKDGRWHSISR